MDPDAPEQEAPPADVAAVPPAESAPIAPDVPAEPVVTSAAAPAESEPEVSPVSPSNIEITNDLEAVAVPEPGAVPPESVAAPTELDDPPATDSSAASAPVLSVLPVPAVPLVPASPSIPPTPGPFEHAPTIDAATFVRLGLAKRREMKADKLSRILAYAQKKGHFKIRDIELALRIPKRTAEEHLKELISAGRLLRRGSVDSTEYSWVD